MESDVHNATLRAPTLPWLAGATMVGFCAVFLIGLASGGATSLGFVLLGLSFACCGRFFTLNPGRVARFFYGEKPSRVRVWSGGSASGMAALGWVFTIAGSAIFAVGVVLALIEG